MKTLLIAAILATSNAFAGDCSTAGPQTPRDITNLKGTNPVVFSEAPDYDEMNLCNIHFHKGAEHKGPEFNVKIDGKNSGFACQKSKSLTQEQLKAPAKKICKNLEPGDTIEVHWVHTTCTTEPGEGLGSCLSKSCANPQLRVETQVFTLVNDKNALNFMDFDLASKKGNYFQAKSIPVEEDGINEAVEFLGSTTGPKFIDKVCSPLQVTWNVRPTCKLLDINSLHEWCGYNKFKENYAHGVRELVTDPKQLSTIDKD